MGKSVREARSAIDSREFTEWLAFNEAYGPIGNYGQWLRHGMLMAQVTAPYLRRGDSVAPKQFMPPFRRKCKRRRKPDVTKMQRDFRAAAKAFAAAERKS